MIRLNGICEEELLIDCSLDALDPLQSSMVLYSKEIKTKYEEVSKMSDIAILETVKSDRKTKRWSGV